MSTATLDLRKFIRDIPNFPKPGIMFRDITPLLSNAEAFRESIRRNPREIATAIFPVLGPAIRKAIAETMAALVRSINSAVEHSFSPRGIRWRLESWRTVR